MLGRGSNLSHELKQIASSTQVQTVNRSNMMAYSISFSVWLLSRSAVNPVLYWTQRHDLWLTYVVLTGYTYRYLLES